MAVARSVSRNSHPNGRCFICGKPAEVNPDRDHATGYGFTRGAYDMRVFLDAEWLRKLTLTLHR